MICPKCGEKTKQFVGAIKNQEVPEVYRNRVCTVCGHKFYTLETIVPYEGKFRMQWRLGRGAVEENYRKKKAKESYEKC